jgi:sugar transferase (PEP-CTERM/EpsH1 system associated)
MQWPALAAGVCHRVHGEHGWEASDPRGQNPRHLRIRRACRPIIHRYVPMSKDIEQWLIRDVRADPARIRQLYSGVDTEKFSPDQNRSPHSVAGRGQKPGQDTVTIGTIGRLDPVKNQISLLRAIASFRPRFPNLRLVIVGDGPLRSWLEDEASSLGVADVVTFTGARNDTPDLLRGFDVFVLPSVNEGISNTILEAMASGLPVVASAVGGNPELVAEGVTGSLYDAGDPGALEQALLPYLTDAVLRETHGAAGRVRVVQNFSLDSMVTRYVALYDELLQPLSSCAA